MAEQCVRCGYAGTRAVLGSQCPECGGLIAQRRGEPGSPIKLGDGIPTHEPTAGASDPLALDPEWEASRAARGARPEARKRRAPIAGVVVAVLLIGVIGAGVYTLARREAEPPVRKLDGPGVSIRIIAVGAHEVSIDGRYAGKTPLQLQLRKSAAPILITAPNLPSRQIVPDRDQLVNLSAP